MVLLRPKGNLKDISGNPQKCSKVFFGGKISQRGRYDFRGKYIPLRVKAEADDFGELMLDISEALVKNSLFEQALVFQEKLVNSQRCKATLRISISIIVYGSGFVNCRFGSDLCKGISPFLLFPHRLIVVKYQNRYEFHRFAANVFLFVSATVSLASGYSLPSVCIRPAGWRTRSRPSNR